MRLLLINKNPVVSRMMHMSVPKAGFDIEECDNVYDLPTGNYEVVVIDDEMYDENFLHDIKQHINYKQLGLISGSKNTQSDEFDFVLTKPFLPTDLIEVLRKVKSSVEEIKEQASVAPGESETPQPQQERSEAEPFDSLLDRDRSPMNSAQIESIVEVEESFEESPFVKDEIKEQGNILDQSELAEVTKLLNDEEHASVEDILQYEEEPIDEKISLVKEEDIAPQPHSLSAPKESKEEAISQEPIQESQPQPIEEPQAPIVEETPPNTPSQPQEPIQSLKDIYEKVDIRALRKVLDGMQIDISIKISYPDSGDV
ncbi:hypothetical protein [Nitratiruptor sp. YY09-18]|uniref:hypothetical protein n=1 Tax=Nitratiruptor sp. YY09-18 TaxID=2724901 RepID=UPI0019163B9D|nr:hypothetical protein [Nitratiruptor sp. YY09-18]BCD68598.1 hypothetical protein NitYY0918_C1515 [Nitratiruptor sp. YY09-18]